MNPGEVYALTCNIDDDEPFYYMVVRVEEHMTEFLVLRDELDVDDDCAVSGGELIQFSAKHIHEGQLTWTIV